MTGGLDINDDSPEPPPCATSPATNPSLIEVTFCGLLPEGPVLFIELLEPLTIEFARDKTSALAELYAPPAKTASSLVNPA
jgi:hypothetical protein